MAKPEETVKSDNQNAEHFLIADHALDAWKHFTTTGGADKNTMVTVVSALLAFSSTIIGYIVTKPLKSDSFVFSKPLAAVLLAGIGCVVSIAAGLVAFIYGRYARTNWTRAHEIAYVRGWHELLPNSCTKWIAPIFQI